MPRTARIAEGVAPGSCYNGGMRTILPTFIAALALSACATLQSPKATQAIHVTQCVVEDDRLGTAVLDPEQAMDWLDKTRDEIMLVRAEMTAAVEKLRVGQADHAQLVVIFDRLERLHSDLEDLVRRLQVCIDTGTSVPAQ